MGKTVEIEYDVVDLPAWDFDTLIGCPELRLALGILKKMFEDEGEEFPQAFLPLLEIADEEVQVALTREALEFVANVFAARNRRLETEMVSKALKPIFRGKEKEMMKTIFEEKFLEGKAEGVAEGEARGEAKSVLTVLRTRFKKVPKGIENAIGKMTDPTALQSLVAYATTCKSLGEFEKALD